MDDEVAGCTDENDTKWMMKTVIKMMQIYDDEAVRCNNNNNDTE